MVYCPACGSEFVSEDPILDEVDDDFDCDTEYICNDCDYAWPAIHQESPVHDDDWDEDEFADDEFDDEDEDIDDW